MKNSASVSNSCLPLMKQKWDQHSSSRESSKNTEHLLRICLPSSYTQKAKQKSGQTSSFISYKISRCNVTIALNYYNIAVACTNKKLVIWGTS